MSIDKNAEVRLFGFRIGKTGTIILAYITLIFFIQYIPQIYYSSYLLLDALPVILANFGFFIQDVFYFIVPISLAGLCITIFILAVKMQESFRSEDIYVKWFSFSLTKTSIAVLFILSLLYTIISSFNFINQLNALINISPYASVQYLSYYILLFITTIVLMVIHIYTLITCIKNREILP